MLLSLMLASNTWAIEMPETARTNGCTTCHAIDKKTIGPSWMDVSKFYNGKLGKSTSGKTVKEATGGQSVEQFLIQKVSKGGHGNWGDYSMVANDNVYNQTTPAKQKKIKELVEFVLALAK
jgi:cytochrome c551/c552